METFETVVQYAKDITTLATFAAILIKPVREWLFGTALIKEGLKCLLRAEIVRLYYRHKDERQLREYEYKNLEFCYRAYKALKGNSFAEHIYEEMQDWKIVS